MPRRSAGEMATRPPSSPPVVRPTVVLTPADIRRRTLLDVDGWWAVDKPPFLPTVGRHLDDQDCLQYWVMETARRMVWSAHQLDADTSGVCLFLRHRSLVPVAQARMAHPVGQKTYLAVVHGAPRQDVGRILAPLGPMPQDPTRQGVTETGRPAATRYRVLQRTTQHAIVALRLETGRTHQIRLHLGHIGLCLVGEAWYRTPPCLVHPRQALHAWAVRFSDGKMPSRIVAPVPDDLRGLIVRLGMDPDALPDPALISL